MSRPHRGDDAVVDGRAMVTVGLLVQGARGHEDTVLDLVADGLSFPTSLTFDEAGTAYLAESGLPFGGAPPGGRVWRPQGDGSRLLLADGLRPPVNGLTFHERSLSVSEGGHPGRISRLDLAGRLSVILDNLPGPENYHTNMVAFGPDDKLYFGQGGDDHRRGSIGPSTCALPPMGISTSSTLVSSR